MARILIDEDEDIRRALRIALVTEGHQVVEARDGQEALSLYQTQQPDLLVSSLDCSRFGGSSVVQVVRQLYPTARILG